MRKLLARAVSESTLAALTLSAGFFLALATTPPPDVSRAYGRSQLVTSASGEVLWGFLAEHDQWRFSTRQSHVDPQYLNLLIAYEDNRFRDHRGVDIFALGRAVLQALRSGRSVSGGSTLTMQVVRMLEPRERTLAAKIDQIAKALKLERMLSKNEILTLYLTLAPFGGNIESTQAASRMYFGKTPERLSLAESALLIALPQSPEARRPDRDPRAAQAARNRVLAALASRHIIDFEQATHAMREPLPAPARSLTHFAPHLAIRLRTIVADGSRETIPTLIDHDLQRHVERIAARAVLHWTDAVNVAVIVLRNRDASVTAYLGGVDLVAQNRKGFVDLVQAVRSPGSALKPFIYALAFEKLIVHPETIITDRTTDIEGYRPDNADGHFMGDMSVRQALIRSRNTPAVMLLHKVGIDAFLARFRSAGRPLRLPGSDRGAGLAVALGGVGVTLEQLTWLFTMFANDGKLHAMRFQPSDRVQSLGQFISPDAARSIADILADVPSPAGHARQRSMDGGRRVGFKTGTSYGFRDAWAIGFDRLHTVGVWVGRADGAAHLGAYGVTAAAPILMQVFDALPVPPHDVAAGAGDPGSLTSLRELPPRLTRFEGAGREEGAARPLEISFPRDGASISIDRASGPAELPLVAAGGRPPYRWVLSGKPQPATNAPTSKWAIDTRGQYELGLIDADGASAKSSFWIE